MYKRMCKRTNANVDRHVYRLANRDACRHGDRRVCGYAYAQAAAAFKAAEAESAKTATKAKAMLR